LEAKVIIQQLEFPVLMRLQQVLQEPMPQGQQELQEQQLRRLFLHYAAALR
jgi:hypothetical protein